MKNDKGEISIMLIITVIVLIVLGMITIFMLTGENGIFILRTDKEETNNTLESNTIDTNNAVENNNIIDANNTVVDNSKQQNVTNNTNGEIMIPVE